MGEFPSGQRGQTVNLLAMPSVVRIHLPPPRTQLKSCVLFLFSEENSAVSRQNCFWFRCQMQLDPKIDHYETVSHWTQSDDLTRFCLFLNAFDEPGHALRAGGFHGPGGVGVGAQGEGRRGVTQVLLQRLHVVSGLQAVHRIGVPQIVEAHFLQT